MEGRGKEKERGERGGGGVGGGGYGGDMERGLGERSGEVGVTEGGLVGEEQCDKETDKRERERARARPRETANLA